MPDVHQEACPLCQIDSDFEYVGGAKKRKHFYCQRCKEFVITDTAERKLLDEANWLEELSKLAVSLNENDGEILHIFFEKREIQSSVVKKKDWL